MKIIFPWARRISLAARVLVLGSQDRDNWCYGHSMQANRTVSCESLMFLTITIII